MDRDEAFRAAKDAANYVRGLSLEDAGTGFEADLADRLVRLCGWIAATDPYTPRPDPVVARIVAECFPGK